ncbi:MAG: HD domain-containing protein [Proteobacteria bacterium]|nr:HD domain-containing protein [Pseudomonadota bacterium]
MSDPYKEAVSICKTIMRNGYDAYVVNARMQHLVMENDKIELDIATDMEFKGLDKLFPAIEFSKEPMAIGKLIEDGVLFRFYPTDIEDGSHPEECVARVTPRLMRKLEESGDIPANLACPYIPESEDRYKGFEGMEGGEVKFKGIPDVTLRRDYLRGIRAMRFAANFGLPIEPNTWIAIVRGAKRMLDYVAVSDIMDEWRKVEAENMASFVQLLFDSMVLHGLIPEIAALSRIKQMKNEDEGGEEETVYAHMLNVMRFYPEHLPYDWIGTLACMFHDVGKLYTAEFFDDRWTFYQHHRVGAKITRKIMNRLSFDPNDTDLVCHLVRHHKRFGFMLTDKGIRRFKALDEYPRLMEMERAGVKARGGNYTEFNHNTKMLERAETPEEMLEPLLNGREIMDFTGLNPGPAVGIIREALLQSQIAGDVVSVPDAVEFCVRYKEREGLS